MNKIRNSRRPQDFLRSEDWNGKEVRKPRIFMDQTCGVFYCYSRYREVDRPLPHRHYLSLRAYNPLDSLERGEGRGRKEEEEGRGVFEQPTSVFITKI